MTFIDFSSCIKMPEIEDYKPADGWISKSGVTLSVVEAIKNEYDQITTVIKKDLGKYLVRDSTYYAKHLTQDYIYNSYGYKNSGMVSLNTITEFSKVASSDDMKPVSYTHLTLPTMA